jgi:hypothetical protein
MVASLFGAGRLRSASLRAKIYTRNHGECEAVAPHFGVNPIRKNFGRKCKRPHMSAALDMVCGFGLP